MLALSIKKDDLVKGMGQTSAIAEKRSTMPILSNILLEAEGGELKITATDMEITFQGTYPAEVTSPGSLTVPAKKLSEVARLLNAETVCLSEGENFTLNLAAGQFSTQMYGLSPADFPRMAAVENIQFVDFEGAALSGVIEKTMNSISLEETRYNLSGVYIEKIEFEGALSLRFVSTDGHRLNMAALSAPDLPNLELLRGVLVSKKGMSELKRMAETSEIVKIGVTQNNLLAKAGGAILVMRLLDGRFPDYTMVVPKSNDKTMIANRKEFLDALKRIATMSSDEYKAVKFSLENRLLTITSMTPELGKAEESLAVEYDCDKIESGFNPRFFIEALNTLVSDKVRVNYSESNTPVLLSAAEDPGYTGVIMSMKI
ncbi:MAG: DNA polymerase III subunit beta [Candidatus Adiutrix sp.]